MVQTSISSTATFSCVRPVSFSVEPPSTSAPPVCERTTVQMCHKTGYNMTGMPNLLNHATQAEAALALKQFLPLTKTACSSALIPFLCSMYVPRCEANGHVPPCRSLCRRAQRGCKPRMQHLQFTWPLKCNNFPRPSEKECIEEDGQIKSEVPKGHKSK